MDNSVAGISTYTVAPQDVERLAAIVAAVQAICTSAATPAAKLDLIRRVITEPYALYPSIGGLGGASGITFK